MGVEVQTIQEGDGMYVTDNDHSYSLTDHWLHLLYEFAFVYNYN